MSEELEMPILREIMGEFGALPGLRIWRQQSGRFKSFDGRRVVHVGIRGMADISGSYRGRRVEIEVKRASGRRTTEQIVWAEQCIERGDAYLLARSADEVQAWLDGLARGL